MGAIVPFFGVGLHVRLMESPNKRQRTGKATVFSTWADKKDGGFVNNPSSKTQTRYNKRSRNVPDIYGEKGVAPAGLITSNTLSSV